MKKNKSSSGNILFYILLAMFLMAVLIIGLTEGPKRNPQTRQLDELVSLVSTDIKAIETVITECAMVYPAAVDVDNDGDVDATDNPNPPYPLYSDLSSGGAVGNAVTAIKCPGAPPAKQVIFSNQAGTGFRVLGDTATYTTTYFNTSAEGILLRITRASSHAMWTEAISRLNARFSTCKAANVTGAAPCANGCFYYWIVRQSGSVLGPEAGCP